jgi:Glycosyl hydrolase family 65, C-terminal domain
VEFQGAIFDVDDVLVASPHDRPWRAWTFGYEGFDPALPPDIISLRFSVHYRGHRVDVSLLQDRISVSTRPGEASPITILVGEEVRELASGMLAEFPLVPSLRA